MLCKKPFMRGTVPFGCGQCLPCRINRARQWTWRQYFESLTHEHNCFVTLTYSPEHLPADGSLEPRELQLFIKRLRKSVGGDRVRYFAVGEYGEQSLRPHYHLSLFGMSGHSVHNGVSGPISGAQAIGASWNKGFVQIGDFNETTAQYTCGYVVKKLRDRKSGALSGLVPEFSRMSRRPGIGTEAMSIIAKSLCSNEHGMSVLESTGDVPRELAIGKRKIPLGRFMLAKLREAVGFTDEYIEQVKAKGSYEKSVEVLALFQDALNSSEGAPVTARQSFAASIEQRIRNTESRAALFASRRKL